MLLIKAENKGSQMHFEGKRFQMKIICRVLTSNEIRLKAVFLPVADSFPYLKYLNLSVLTTLTTCSDATKRNNHLRCL